MMMIVLTVTGKTPTEFQGQMSGVLRLANLMITEARRPGFDSWAE